MALSLRSQAIGLYRKICREIPRTCVIFNLDISEHEFRRRIRAKFDENKHLKDEEVIQHVLRVAQQEFLEVQNHHAQRHHVLKLISTKDDNKISLLKYNTESEFLKKFYDNQIF